MNFIPQINENGVSEVKCKIIEFALWVSSFQTRQFQGNFPGHPLRFPRYFFQVILYQTYIEIPNIRHISALALKLQPIDFFY